VWKYGRHPTPEIRRGKKERKKKETTGQNIVSTSAMQGRYNKGILRSTDSILFK